MNQKGNGDVSLLFTVGIVLGVLALVLGFIQPFAPTEFIPFTSSTYPAKPETAEIQILTTPPQQTYVEIGKITAYAVDEQKAINKIVKKAKEVGADAVIIKESVRKDLAQKVTAVAVVFK